MLTEEETTARYAAAAFTFVAASLILLALVFRWKTVRFEPETLLIFLSPYKCDHKVESTSCQ